MERTVVHIIKKTSRYRTLNDRVALVESNDALGIIRADIPRYPQGTVLDDDGDTLTVKGVRLRDGTIQYDGGRVSALKDLEALYNMTKDILPYWAIQHIAEVYPSMSAIMFTVNPYFIFSPVYFKQEEIDSFFITPEDISRKIVSSTFIRRKYQIQAFIMYELHLSESGGSTCETFGALKSAVKEKLKSIRQPLTSLEDRYFASFINELNSYALETRASEDDFGKDKIFYMDTRDFSDTALVARTEIHNIENNIYKGILSRYKADNILSSCTIYPNDNLSAEQNYALDFILKSRGNVCIMTGGPGTGKTTVISEVVDTVTKQGLSVKVIAPTGKAARRSKDSLHALGIDSIQTSTIHRLLGYGTRNEDEKEKQLEAVKNINLIIIDEFSMANMSIFEEFLENTDVKNTKILIVGDADQLLSVEAGNLLYDLIHMGVPTVTLKQNHRSLSDIKEISGYINRQMTDETIAFLKDHTDPDGDVVFVDVAGKRASEVLDSVTQASIDNLFSSDKSGIIITPWRKDSIKISSESINAKIWNGLSEINHNKKYVAGFRMDDPVIIGRTNYKTTTPYCNGDVGRITGAKMTDDEGLVYIITDPDGKELYVSAADKVSLSYAITAHKAEGSEYDTVYLVLPDVSQMVTTRLIFTMATRAKKKLVIFSTYKTITEVLGSKNEEHRDTYLSTVPMLK